MQSPTWTRRGAQTIWDAPIVDVPAKGDGTPGAALELDRLGLGFWQVVATFWISDAQSIAITGAGTTPREAFVACLALIHADTRLRGLALIGDRARALIDWSADSADPPLPVAGG